MSFRLKTILGIAIIEIILLSFLIFASMQYLKSSNEQQLIDRARTSAQLLATMATDAVVSLDLATLDALILKTVSNPDISYIRVRHVDGFILTEKGDVNALQQKFSTDQNIADAQEDFIFDVQHNITISNVIFGSIELGLSTHSLEELLKKASRQMLGLALFEVLLVGIFGFILSGILTRQLKALQIGAREISNGKLGHVVPVIGKDELAETAASFNNMSISLETYAHELKKARDIADKKRVQAESILDEAVNNISQGVLIVDENNYIVLVNKAFADIYGLKSETMEKLLTCEDIYTAIGDKDEFKMVCNINLSEFETPISKFTNGRCVMHSYKPIPAGGSVWVDTDITSVMEAEERNKILERELLQSQKMESIGTLAGGIAHEINTPIQYIDGNIKFIEETTGDIMNLISNYTQLVDEIKTKDIQLNTLQACEKSYEDADIDFLRGELPEAIEQSRYGVKQVSKIVLAMKEFAHPSSKDKAPINLNAVIERSLIVGKAEWKTIAELEVKLDDDLPLIMAHEGNLNQVVLNLIVNATHAIAENSIDIGHITITTTKTENTVVLIIQDDGCGIPQKIKDRIFDPFFTTKEVGKGTGQGLAICHDIIVNKHDGKIDVKSVHKEGTTFTITLPLLGSVTLTSSQRLSEETAL